MLCRAMDHDEELLDELFGDDRVHRVLVAELGEELADALRRVRRPGGGGARAIPTRGCASARGG